MSVNSNLLVIHYFASNSLNKYIGKTQEAIWAIFRIATNETANVWIGYPSKAIVHYDRDLVNA